MKRLILFLGIALAGYTTAAADQSTYSTYYPAPFGRYINIITNQMQLIPITTALPGTCTVGTLVVDSTNQLQYCTTPTTWNAISGGVWVQDKKITAPTHNYLYPMDNSGIDFKIGIGTITPTFKLHLNNDGGIIAQGTWGSGDILPDLSWSSAFIWYPRKAALRAGVASTNQWYTGNIGDYSVAFGVDNQASATYSVISGGQTNTATANHATVGGGTLNNATQVLTTVSGGYDNDATGTASTVGGGYLNKAIGPYSTVSGGRNNIANINFASIGGGGSTIVGDGNEIYSTYSTVAGGHNNVITGINSIDSVIAGGQDNDITNAVDFARYNSILGGWNNNITNADYGTIGGGQNNNINNQDHATIAGGFNNTTNAQYAVVDGGANNTSSGLGSTVAGGDTNTASGSYSFVGGGDHNNAFGDYNFISAGKTNIIEVGKNYSAILGHDNTIHAASSFIFGNDNLISAGYSMTFGYGNSTCGAGGLGGNFVWGFDFIDATCRTDSAMFFPNGKGVAGTPNNGKVSINTITEAGTALSVNGRVKISLTNFLGAGSTAKYKFDAGSGLYEMGFDVAELFDTSEEVEVGDVLVIDENNVRKLTKNSVAYDKKVAGIASGAPAILFEGSDLYIAPKPGDFTKGKKPPMALAGRVPCKVSIENGPIEVGDLLTTSSTPGHAMKATDPAKSFGAILGKALEPFKGGPNGEKTGTITVLVTLQ